MTPGMWFLLVGVVVAAAFLTIVAYLKGKEKP